MFVWTICSFGISSFIRQYQIKLIPKNVFALANLVNNVLASFVLILYPNHLFQKTVAAQYVEEKFGHQDIFHKENFKQIQKLFVVSFA